MSYPGVGPHLGSESVGQYEKFELTLPLWREYENPFDPGQIDLCGSFVTPSGKTLEVPGFYYRPFQRSRDENGNEMLRPAGPPCFKVRFAWGEVGDYRFQVKAKDADGEHALCKGTFSIIPAAARGHIRVSSRCPTCFEFESGEPFFAIGANLPGPRSGGTYDYDRWLPRFAAHGGNYARLWLCGEAGKLGLEHRSVFRGDGCGLGRYNTQSAWRIDHIIQTAERLGFALLMCIDTFQNFDATGKPGRHTYGAWDRNPYFAGTAGPCRTPIDFFADEEARRLYRRRLRYFVARWGYSTAVFAWEFWNEVDQVTGYESEVVAEWHQAMARHLKSRDPWRHMTATSYARSHGDQAVDALPELDFVRTHGYAHRDLAAAVHRHSREKIDAYGKPHYWGEFGAHWLGQEEASDPHGIHLHNGIWADVHSRSAGTAMYWWWDSYVERHHLHYHYTALAAYTRDINWIEENYGWGKVVSVEYADDPPAYGTLTIQPQSEKWADESPYNQPSAMSSTSRKPEPENRPHTYVIRSDGTMEDYDLLSKIQYGANYPEDRNPATFRVSYPADGAFEVVIRGVSCADDSQLTIYLDGKAALVADFPASGGGATMHAYDRAYRIEVPAGQHEITVENTGRDWFHISGLRLSRYLSSPNLRVLAMSNDHSAIMWVQNKDNTWWNHRNGFNPSPVAASQITLDGFRDGSYQVEQWDTYAGRPVMVTTTEAERGRLVVKTPVGLTTDVAYKIRRVEEGPHQTP